MKKILQKIDEWVANHVILDDPLHILLGVVFGMFMFLFLGYTGLITDVLYASPVVFVATFIFGYFIKEVILDKTLKGTHISHRDWIMTQIGGTAVILYMLLIYATSF